MTAMRGLFHQPRPRRFAHRFLYIDERQERLRLLRAAQQADKGTQKEEESTTERHIRLHDRFAEAAQKRRQQRHFAQKAAWSWGLLAAVVATLALLLMGVSR